MKITTEHFHQMSAAIEKLLQQHPGIAAQYRARDLTINRFRWDALCAANFGAVSGTAWISHELYPYLNDSHIETALKRIIPNWETTQ